MHRMQKQKYYALFLHRAEDGPSCILIQALGARRTHFTWLLNMDVKVKLCYSYQIRRLSSLHNWVLLNRDNRI